MAGRHAKKPPTGAEASVVQTNKQMTGQPTKPEPGGAKSPIEVLQAFASTALERVMEMPGIPSGPAALPGGSMDFALSPQGLIEFVELRCEANLTITLGGGTLRISQRGPYNMLGKIFAYDPDNWPHIINCDGAELNFDDLTIRKFFPHDPASSVGAPATYDYGPGVEEYPVTAGTQVWEFMVPVRLAIDPDRLDFRGMLDLAAANARARIQYVVNQSILGTTEDSVLVTTGGAPTVVLNSLIVTPIMHFRQPVNVVEADGTTWKPWPQNELDTVHECTSSRYSALNPGAQNPIPFPTGRDYIKVIEQLVIGGVQVMGSPGASGFGASGATRVQFLVNDTTPIWDMDVREYFRMIRRRYGRDFYFWLWDLSGRVWDSNQYGDLVTSLVLASGLSNVGSYIQQYRKCTYVAGTVTPLNQVG